VSISSSFTLNVGGVLVGHDQYLRGALEIREGRVQAVSESAGEGTEFALPGLRNAHVHFDLSGIGGPLGAGLGFADWIERLMLWRGRQTTADLVQGARVGARQALAAGTTAVGDIDSTGSSFEAVAESGLKGIGFREVLGTGDCTSVLASAEEFGMRYGHSEAKGGLRPGLSPHAPYSTSDRLYQGARDLARRRSWPLSTHVAETTAEELFLMEGRGDLAELLGRLGVRQPFDRPPGRTPLGNLAALDCLGPDVLLAHVNYPAAGDLEALAQSGATVVYCPRSHAHFSHARHPVAELLELGVTVALGTDSMASNRSLSMFDEMAFLRGRRPDLPPSQVFQMATSAAAPFLDGGRGRLDPGQPADLVIARSPGGLPADLDEALQRVTTGDLEILATLVSGRLCYVSNDLEQTLPCLTWGRSWLFSADSGGRSEPASGRPGKPDGE